MMDMEAIEFTSTNKSVNAELHFLQMQSLLYSKNLFFAHIM